MENKEAKEDELKELRANLEPEIFTKIEFIKKYFGIKNTTELIRFLINRTEREVHEAILEYQTRQMRIDMFTKKFEIKKNFKPTEEQKELIREMLSEEKSD